MEGHSNNDDICVPLDDHPTSSESSSPARNGFTSQTLGPLGPTWDCDITIKTLAIRANNYGSLW